MIHKSSTIKTMSEHKVFDHQTSSEDVENLSVLNVETSEESNINEAQPNWTKYNNQFISILEMRPTNSFQ